MIRHSWTDAVPEQVRPELAALLAQAAAEDLEGGFPVLALDDRKAQHLLVHLLPDERAEAQQHEVLAAYLRLTAQDDGSSAAEYVVHPEHRSRGVTTLLVERMGLDVRAPGGWDGTGATTVVVQATGDHPAAARLANRFRRTGMRPSRTDWHLVAPVRGAAVPEGVREATPEEAERAAALHRDERPLDSAPTGRLLVVGDGFVHVDPTRTAETEYGTSGSLTAVLPPAARTELALTPLLQAGLAALADAGLRVGALTVRADDEPLVRACRLSGFSHYRTDTEYTVA